MKRLLRISSGTLALSLSSILIWLLLGVILNKDIANIFSLTYPLQFAYLVFVAIFATGANIKSVKEKNQNAVPSGMIFGSIIGAIFCLVMCLNVDGYISFMNMQPSTYHDFAIFSIIALYLQMLFSFCMEKLYFEEKEKLANRHSLIFNIITLVTTVGLALIVKSTLAIIITPLVVMFMYIIGMFIWQFKNFKLDFNILTNFKYESLSICSNILMFTTYFLGLSNAFSAGAEYIVAINFVTLISDAQWDACGAILTAAKVDLSYGKFNFKQSLKNSFCFMAIVVSSVIVLFFSLFSVYNVKLEIGLILLGMQIFDFFITAFSYTFRPYAQLEFSAVINTIIGISEKVIRIILSTFLPTAYCNEIAQITTACYLFIWYMIILFKFIRLNNDGTLTKKIRKAEEPLKVEEEN